MESYQVFQYLEEWQRCLPDNLPNLFNFYSEKYSKTERVTSFLLESDDLIKLVQLKPEKIRILMGCEPEETKFGEVPNKPAFTPILQAVLANTNDKEPYADCFKLHYVQWDNEPYEKGIHLEHSRIVKDPGWISTDTAQLFMLAWLECPFNRLGAQFEGVGTTSTLRVRFFEYSYVETQDIIDTINKFGVASAKVLMNMGLSLPVQGHPFGFRPIIEVLPQQLAGRAQEDGEDGEYFEFSYPCPPLCNY